VNLQPLADKLIIKVIEPTNEKTKGGLYVPDTAKEKPQEGEVLAVGPGARNEKGDRVPIDLAVGDKVIFSKYAGTEIKVDGEAIFIMAERDIMAKFV